MSNPQDSRNLPEGVIDAEPAGGWESEESARTQSGDDRTSSGLPPNTPDGTDATADATAHPDAPTAPAGPIEGDAAGRGADPDLVDDADLERAGGADPEGDDPSTRGRQDGL